MDEKDVQLEPVGLDNRPLNGSKFLQIPRWIAEFIMSDELKRSEEKILLVIIAHYQWKTLSAPTLSNEELSQMTKLKNQSIRSGLSQLKKKGIIKPEYVGSVRVLRIPSLENKND